jgi:hypothetical protein
MALAPRLMLNLADLDATGLVQPASRVGWRLAVAVLFVQALGDAFNLIRGDFVRGGVGFVIAVLVLLYLWRPGTRAAFSST